MTDTSAQATLAAALERMRVDLTARADLAGLTADNPVRTLIFKTLDQLQDQLLRDPAWFDGLVRQATSAALDRNKNGTER